MMRICEWLGSAWDDVTRKTIANCWRHADILGVEHKSALEDTREPSARTRKSASDDMAMLASLIDQRVLRSRRHG